MSWYTNYNIYFNKEIDMETRQLIKYHIDYQIDYPDLSAFVIGCFPYEMPLEVSIEYCRGDKIFDVIKIIKDIVGDCIESVEITECEYSEFPNWEYWEWEQ
jgi:hypothetical protein